MLIDPFNASSYNRKKYIPWNYQSMQATPFADYWTRGLGTATQYDNIDSI